MKKRKPGFILLFYLVVGYVLLQFFWWAYLLINLSHLAIEGQALQQDWSVSMQQQLSQTKTLMIIGEGSVFIVLLSIGLYQIRKSFLKELRLANQQQNFMMAVTHELRTPLSAIKLQIQTIQRRKELDPDQQEKLLHKAVTEIDRLSQLTDNILTASQANESELVLDVKKVHLYTLLHELTPVFHEKIPHILIDESCQVNIRADESAIRSVFSNLMENTIKYAKPEEVIRINCSVQGNKDHIKYADIGPGIPNEQQKLVFEQFYRGGNELTRNTKGTGLGLFICKQLLNRMQGQIKIDPTYKQGACFVISLPIN